MSKVNMASLIVQNSGKGLDQLIIKGTFEPFFAGIGMALAIISRALIETKGGRPWLDPDASQALNSTLLCLLHHDYS